MHYPKKWDVLGAKDNDHLRRKVVFIKGNMVAQVRPRLSFTYNAGNKEPSELLLSLRQKAR